MQENIRFKTERLLLRGLKTFDAKYLLNAILQSTDCVKPWLTWCSAEFSLSDAEKWIQSSKLNWHSNSYYELGVFDRKSGELAGCVYLSSLDQNANMANLGYWIFGKYQQRGYAYEASMALIKYAFLDIKLTRLEIVIRPENNASIAMANKLGAKFECLARNRFVYNELITDGNVYSLIPSDFNFSDEQTN